MRLQTQLWMALALAALPATRATTTGNRHVAALHCAESEACVARADAEVLQTLRAHRHNATEPCANFWDYACGDWTSAPYYDHIDTFGALSNRYAEELHELLLAGRGVAGERIAEEETPELLRQLRAYYRACRETKTFELQYGEYLERLPAMPSWQTAEIKRAFTPDAEGEASAAEFNWWRAVAELRRHGLNGVFLDESADMAQNDSAAYVIELAPPADDADFGSKYELLQLMGEFGLTATATVTEERATLWQQQLATQVYELDVSLRELRAKQPPTAEDEALMLAELRQSVPSIDWLEYFAALLGVSAEAVPPQLPVQLAGGRAYLRELAALLAHTPPRTIYRYVLLKLCKFLLATSPQINDKNCVAQLGVAMPLGLDYVYERHIYGGQRRADDELALQTLFASLQRQFGVYLAANKLQLSATERDYLTQKLDGMRLRIGNLPLAQPPAYYERHYAAANVSAGDYYRNHWELLRFRAAQQHAPLLALPAPARLESLDAFYVNDDVRQVRNAPYYVHQRNLLVVPMMFLQLPFHHARLRPLLQYSLVGWILAHELNHAFETVGILYDAAGRESSPLGVAISQRRRFVDAVTCLERTPSAALIERLADVNGFQLAYDAYFASSAVAADADWLAATEFSAPQLFFLNFAQFFCGQLPTAIAHDRDDVRVNEVAANMPEFALAYSCAAGQREHPADKCQMWRP